MSRTSVAHLVRNLSNDAIAVCRRLTEAGHRAYVVGGAVRDIARGVAPVDYDIATSAHPSEVQKLFRRVIPTGIKHGTVTILMGDHHVEVTTFRTETTYTDHRHPDEVRFASTIEEDLSRRDFTINGMALDPLESVFIDPFGGQQDLTDRLIRAIGVPEDRFGEDALRILRALRFATQLEFAVEPATFDAIKDAAGTLAAVSCERVRDELIKILSSREPSIGFRLMKDSDVLSVILPELASGIGVEQRGGHRFDVFGHSILACDYTPRDNLTVRMAALLHDIGKPASLVVQPDGTRTFHGHDVESASQAETLLRRLRFPNRLVSDVAHLVRHHMFNYTSDWSDAAVRRFLARVGVEYVDDLFEVRRADSRAQQGTESSPAALPLLTERIAGVLKNDHALTRKDLAVTGRDLMGAGIPAGPLMGVVIDHLFETVLDDPAQNTTGQLTKIAVQFYESRLAQG